MPSPYQRQLFDYIHRSGRIGIDVLYYVDRSEDRDWAVEPLNFFETILPGRTLGFLGNSAHYNGGILRTLGSLESDIFVVSDYSAPTAQIAMRYLTNQRKPWIFWGEIPGFKERGSLGNWIRKQLQHPLSSADAIAAIGKKAATAYSELYPQKPIFNIPYFCDLKPFLAGANSRTNRGSEKSELTVLFSGQLIHRKGVDVLVKAFNEVAPKHKELNLVLLGSGSSEQSLKDLVDRDFIDRVHFKGHQEASNLANFFSKADIFCLPSRHDGWGVVVNEALGAGLPIIVTSAVGASDDLVRNGQNGLIVPPDDVSSLAEALTLLCDNPDLRQNYSAASAEMASRWDLGEGADRWIKAITNILAREPK